MPARHSALHHAPPVAPSALATSHGDLGQPARRAALDAGARIEEHLLWAGGKLTLLAHSRVRARRRGRRRAPHVVA